jgi:hypothetical protein
VSPPYRDSTATMAATTSSDMVAPAGVGAAVREARAATSRSTAWLMRLAGPTIEPDLA